MLFKDSYYGITLITLSGQYIIILILSGIFGHSWLFNLLIIFCSVVLAFLTTCLAIPLNKRYGLSGPSLIYGFILWPWTLIRAPKLIAKLEHDRKMKIIHDVMES